MIDFSLITTEQWIIGAICLVPICFALYLAFLILVIIVTSIFTVLAFIWWVIKFLWNIIATIIGWFIPSYRAARKKRKDKEEYDNYIRMESLRCQVCGAIDYGPSGPCKCYRKRI